MDSLQRILCPQDKAWLVSWNEQRTVQSSLVNYCRSFCPPEVHLEEEIRANDISLDDSWRKGEEAKQGTGGFGYDTKVLEAFVLECLGLSVKELCNQFLLPHVTSKWLSLLTSVLPTHLDVLVTKVAGTAHKGVDMEMTCREPPCSWTASFSSMVDFLVQNSLKTKRWTIMFPKYKLASCQYTMLWVSVLSYGLWNLPSGTQETDLVYLLISLGQLNLRFNTNPPWEDTAQTLYSWGLPRPP